MNDIASLGLKQALVAWKQRYPDISEQDALADLWYQGIECEETYAAMNRRKAAAGDVAHNVVKHPDQLHGWHVGWVESWKPGVVRFFATKNMTAINGFIALDVLRVAIETHVIAKPNGYSQP